MSGGAVLTACQPHYMVNNYPLTGLPKESTKMRKSEMSTIPSLLRSYFGSKFSCPLWVPNTSTNSKKSEVPTCPSAIEVGRDKGGTLYHKADDFSKVCPKDVIGFIRYFHFSKSPCSGDAADGQDDRSLVGLIDSWIACKIDFVIILIVMSKIVPSHHSGSRKYMFVARYPLMSSLTLKVISTRVSPFGASGFVGSA